MNIWLLDYLCDPVDQSDLSLKNAQYNAGRDKIVSGELHGGGGRMYPIINGIPRFVEQTVQRSVDGFGDQWNYFNYDDFYLQWRDQTVKYNWGTPDWFKGRTVVDAGAGHGMQSRWMAEAGAERVIALELSHTVDDVLMDNLKASALPDIFERVAVVQCSIDQLPIKPNSVHGLVLCHNVIQHTPVVARTAQALWAITAPGSDFVFNCYTRTDDTWLHRARYRTYRGVRQVLQRCPFWVRLGYAHLMSALRFVPGLGWLLEKSNLMMRGIVIPGPHWFARAYRAGLIITYDSFGAHGYQHHLSFAEQMEIARDLQPDERKWSNVDVYFSRPMPVSAALHLTK